MRKTLIQKHNELLEKAETFAIAQIIRRVNPSSGKPGDKAIITSNGEIHGWIGGGCTRGIVLKESLLAIKEKKSRLVSILPGATESKSSYTKTYKMTCQSGGEVDVYIEPVIPQPMLTIFGSSHIARALAKMSMAMGYKTTLILHDLNNTPEDEIDSVITLEQYISQEKYNENQYILVSTQGFGDYEALSAAVNSPYRYLGFVASKIKAAGILKQLKDDGIPHETLFKIKTPAGIDINAKSPEEVAISILAEVIKDYRFEEKGFFSLMDEPITVGDDYYVNPVCKIPVLKSTAKHVLEHNNEKVYFCCDGCKISFEKNPKAYIPSLV